MTEPAITFLQACPNIFEAVRPYAIFVLVFPIIASGGNRLMIFINQHRFEAGGAELDAKSSLSTLNCFLDIVPIHIYLLCFETINSNRFLGEETVLVPHRSFVHCCLDIPLIGP